MHIIPHFMPGRYLTHVANFFGVIQIQPPKYVDTYCHQGSQWSGSSWKQYKKFLGIEYSCIKNDLKPFHYIRALHDLGSSSITLASDERKAHEPGPLRTLRMMCFKGILYYMTY